MPDPGSTSLLVARGLSAALPSDSGTTRVLDDVSLSLTAGEIVDIVGPSGSGKTTLLRALARLLPNVTGELLLRGTPAEKIEPRMWRAAVALLPQKPVTVPGTIEDNVLLPWRLKVRIGQEAPAAGRLRQALDDVGLADIALERDASRLSVGQQARIALVRSTLTAPDVLLLDEADAALDDASAEAVRAVIARFSASGGAAVRVRHRESDGMATRRLRLQAGRPLEVVA